MSDLFAAFGLDWRLLLINAVNFGLLLLALWYFLYEPLTKMLEERRQRVAQGVRDAEAAAHKLKSIEESRTSKLAEATKEADLLVSQARASGAAKGRELVANAEAAAATLLDDAAKEAAELKLQALAESKQEVAKLIVLGLEKKLIEAK